MNNNNDINIENKIITDENTSEINNQVVVSNSKQSNANHKIVINNQIINNTGKELKQD